MGVILPPRTSEDGRALSVAAASVRADRSPVERGRVARVPGAREPPSPACATSLSWRTRVRPRPPPPWATQGRPGPRSTTPHPPALEDSSVADQLIIRGAREHNLKDVSLELPRDSLIVFTGLSGSGKSSLAFDTIFAEGQRRYVESLSAYARQFLGQMDKPDVDFIEGLSPSVSIDQKSTSKNP